MNSKITWQNYSQQNILSAFLRAAQHCNASLAIWQETATDSLYVLLSYHPALRCALPDTLPAGFVYNAFNAPAEQSFFLPADLLYVFQDNQLLTSHINSPLKEKNFLTTLKTCLAMPEKTTYYTTEPPHVDDESKAAFIALVSKGLAQIKQGSLQKVVLARTKTICLSPSFDVIDMFLNLTRIPRQFVSLLSTPNEGTWLGCSPELLLAIDNLAMSTLSLAGTVHKDQEWSEKEYQEQGLVNTFIRDILRDLNLTQVKETSLDTVKIGNFKHLKTHFHIRLSPEQREAGIFSRLLTLLHPTPALCGLPQQGARLFIRQHEHFERHLYGGYWGPCNIQTRHARLYVNIRCMQVFSRQARLFLGAGITDASDPEAEWRETCLKSQTLLSTL